MIKLAGAKTFTMRRDDQILGLRSEIKTIDFEMSVSKAEQFQNKVLRPIIKFQHDLIVSVFDSVIKRKKIDLESLSSDRKVRTITTIMKNDRSLVNELRGLIVGLFTVEEYQEYTMIKSEINRRIIQIIRERLLSLVQ